MARHESKIRYAQGQLHDAAGPQGFEHFYPLSDSERDKFGNRIFSSKNKIFLDREGQELQASLLVSPDGDVLLKKYPGLLTKLEAGLRELEDLKLKERFLTKDKVDLPNLGTLETLVQGGQAKVYKLSLPKDSLAVKTILHYYNNRVDQPFINEMLQMQELANEAGRELNGQNIYLPKYYFASGQVLAREYVKGDRPQHAELLPVLKKGQIILQKFIEARQQNNNRLWENVHLDIRTKNFSGWLTEYFKQDNFVKTEDGKFFCIDLFYVRREDQ